LNIVSMKKALITFCCAFILLLSVDYGSHCSGLGGFVYPNSKHHIIDLWWTIKRDASFLIGVAAVCAAVIYARDRKQNRTLELRPSEHGIRRETTFLIGIVSSVLIIWPFIFYKLFRSERVISITLSAAVLSMVAGSVLAICGLLTSKESRQELYYYGKTICAVIVMLELVGALLMMRSCVEGLRRIQ
jgi:hypothetical protein